MADPPRRLDGHRLRPRGGRTPCRTESPSHHETTSRVKPGLSPWGGDGEPVPGPPRGGLFKARSDPHRRRPHRPPRHFEGEATGRLDKRLNWLFLAVVSSESGQVGYDNFHGSTGGKERL